MKILYCHNYYRHRGGEDVSFDTDVRMLKNRGHEVLTFTKDNSRLPGNQLQSAGNAIWNRATAREVGEIIERESPDVLHCNNLFPQISSSVYRAAKTRGVPVVQALRNYRSFCANSFFYRDGNVCTKCLKSTAAWSGIQHRCYRDSVAASTAVAVMQISHRLTRTRQRYVDCFFTPTEFSRQVHLDGGFDPAKVFVRSNYLLPDLGASTAVADYAVFVGRLSDEKGVETIVEAWRKSGTEMPLRIVGDGPAMSQLQTQASQIDHIEFFGQLDADGVQEQIAGAKVLLMTSRWYETFGRTIAEAFSRGVPVIASRLGAMAELIEDGINGFHFTAGDAESLNCALERLNRLDVSAEQEMRQCARQRFEEKFCAEVSYQQLLDVYRYAGCQSVPESCPLKEPVCQ